MSTADARTDLDQGYRLNVGWVETQREAPELETNVFGWATIPGRITIGPAYIPDDEIEPDEAVVEDQPVEIDITPDEGGGICLQLTSPEMVVALHCTLGDALQLARELMSRALVPTTRADVNAAYDARFFRFAVAHIEEDELAVLHDEFRQTPNHLLVVEDSMGNILTADRHTGEFEVGS